jgi:uncharacterized protein (UPF0248 family)
MAENIKYNPKIILNEIKWRDKFDLDKIIIYYLHRGSPNNIKMLNGVEIVKIGKSFIETNSSHIPFHRILEIKYGDKILFDRKRL